MENFDAKYVKNQIVNWIKNWFEENGKGCNAVIGLSGGKDSNIVAALCVEALGKDRVIGVTMPNVVQTDETILNEDLNCVAELVDCLGIKLITVPISPAYCEILRYVEKELGGENNVSEQTKINLAPRIRMTTLYAVSQSVNGRVANTCNLSEDYIGYSTRWGDNIGDFAPIRSLTVTELKELGKELNIPYHLVSKVPADGLCGKTDEDNFGFTYEELDKYILTGLCENKDIETKILSLHNKNKFKEEPIPKFNF